MLKKIHPGRTRTGPWSLLEGRRNRGEVRDDHHRRQATGATARPAPPDPTKDRVAATDHTGPGEVIMGGGPKRQSSDKLRTTCKRCGEGIYNSDVAYWQRTPVMGLIHMRCAAQPPEEPKK